MDPLTGDFTQADPSGYSPAALVFLEFTRQLSKSTPANTAPAAQKPVPTPQ
jgi:hypothetical protein